MKKQEEQLKEEKRKKVRLHCDERAFHREFEGLFLYKNVHIFACLPCDHRMNKQKQKMPGLLMRLGKKINQKSSKHKSKKSKKQLEKSYEKLMNKKRKNSRLKKWVSCIGFTCNTTCY